MLGPLDAIVRLNASTKLTREWLPPTDTADAVVKTKNGVTGTSSVSFRSGNSGSEYTTTRDKGYVSFIRGGVLQCKMIRSVTGKVGKSEVTKKEFDEDGTDGKEKICASAEAFARGNGLDPRQALEKCDQEFGNCI